MRTNVSLWSRITLWTLSALRALRALAAGHLNDDSAVILDSDLRDVIGELDGITAITHRVTSGRTRISPRTTPYTMSVGPD